MAIFSVLGAAVARWWGGTTLSSFFTFAGLTAAMGFLAVVYADVKTAGGAQAKLDTAVAECHASQLQAENDALAALANSNHEAAVAADRARANAQAEANQKSERIADLEQQLKNQPAPPQCGYSPDVTGSLRK